MKILATIPLLLASFAAIAQQPGSLDPLFGNAGKIITTIDGGQSKATAVALQNDGKIVIAASFNSPLTANDFVCLRYNNDGSIDETFGSNGMVLTDLQLGSDDIPTSIAIQPDGMIVIGGYSDNGSNKEAAIVRYDSNGAIDSSFGTNGISLIDFDNGLNDEIHSLKIHALTGNIIVGGNAIESSSIAKPVIARVLTDGSLDISFEGNGIRLLDIGNLDYQYFFSVEDLVVQPNGRISAVGWRDFPGLSWDSDYWACRVNSDGSMDDTFSGDGVAVYNGGFNGHDRGFAMTLESDNSIRMAGGGYVSTLQYEMSAFGIDANGSSNSWDIVADFGSSLADIAYAMSKDSNGNYILAGSSGSTSNKTFAIVRASSSGSLDSNFGTGGKVSTTFGTNALNECLHMTLQSDDKIIAVGYAGNDIAIARYLGEGQPELNGFDLNAPANGAMNQNFASMSLNWDDAYLATTYEIELDFDDNFSNPELLTSLTSNKSLSGLIPNTTYFWRVRATDGTNWGDFTSPWSFTTNSLNNFSLSLPANNASGVLYSSLTLDWTNATGATYYEIEVAQNDIFTVDLQTFTETTSTSTLQNLDPETTYFWRVRAGYNAELGDWSTIWNFTTEQSQNINEISNLSLLLFPNPSADIVNLHNLPVGCQSIAILNVTGKIVKTITCAGNSAIVDVSYLENGIYSIVAGHLSASFMKID